jgi:hypothetical protein
LYRVILQVLQLVTPLKNMAPKRKTPAAAASKPLAAAPVGEVKLPPFNDETPMVWFNNAEAYFEIKGLADRRLWFFYTQWALSPQQGRLVTDITSLNPPPADAYHQLKDRLLHLYDLDERSRLDKLIAMPPLGGRRPSELLAAMRQLVSPGEENTAIFRHMFFRRLPSNIQIQLGEDRSSSTAELAARADDLLAAAKTAAMPVAAVEEVQVVAESRSSKRKKPQWGEKKRPHTGGDGGRSSNGGNQAAIAGWTCFAHTKFGDKASRCHPACSRAGN